MAGDGPLPRLSVGIRYCGPNRDTSDAVAYVGIVVPDGHQAGFDPLPGDHRSCRGDRFHFHEMVSAFVPSDPRNEWTGRASPWIQMADRPPSAARTHRLSGRRELQLSQRACGCFALSIFNYLLGCGEAIRKP